MFPIWNVSQITMVDNRFGILAGRVSKFIGSVWAMIFVSAAIVVSGAYFGFSERWESRAALSLTAIALLSVFYSSVPNFTAIGPLI